MSDEELVVLLDEQLRPCGTAPKSTVHTDRTPLHLAFSCYLFDTSGRVLLTRRSLAKRTWPGVWTNSFCGHPGPGEEPADALRRRARAELGLTGIREPRLALPRFRYRATAADGMVENEFCPVWTASTDTDPAPDPAEVCEWRWIDWPDLTGIAQRTPWLLSPWASEQIRLLAHDGLSR